MSPVSAFTPPSVTASLPPAAIAPPAMSAAERTPLAVSVTRPSLPETEPSDSAPPAVIVVANPPAPVVTLPAATAPRPFTSSPAPPDRFPVVMAPLPASERTPPALAEASCMVVPERRSIRSSAASAPPSSAPPARTSMAPLAPGTRVVVTSASETLPTERAVNWPAAAAPATSIDPAAAIGAAVNSAFRS